MGRVWLVVPLVAVGVFVAPSVARAAADTPPVTYPVFATREGLVGGTTANGHVIVDRDHFAALPSRRGLSTKGTGDFTVRVCAASTSRCAYAPVWDVGPWNTRDDYWNEARENWPDLPRGTPEAQAAYTDGYNGGKDQFGRQVQNPAGIDLADGTFWDALLLTDNAWVTVTYLWTGTGGVHGRIDVGGAPLRLRSAPNTSASIVGLAGEYSQVPIECQVVGDLIAGRVRTTDLWNRVAPGTYLSHAFTAVPAGVVIPRCERA
jgi:hypothetical protein